MVLPKKKKKESPGKIITPTFLKSNFRVSVWLGEKKKKNANIHKVTSLLT